MKIQIVDSETGEVIFVPQSNITLERDLLAVFKERADKAGPLARRRYAHLVREVTEVCAELRELTRRV